MKVLVFGNPLSKMDSSAVKIAKMLEGKLPEVSFKRFDAAEDLEKEGEELFIMDAVVGLEHPRLVTLEGIELSANPISLHGFDLAWSLLLLKKLGKIKRAVIIGVPAKQSAAKNKEAVKKLLMPLLSEGGKK